MWGVLTEGQICVSAPKEEKTEDKGIQATLFPGRRGEFLTSPSKARR